MIQAKLHPGELIQQEMLNEIEMLFHLKKQHGLSLEAKVHEIRKGIKRLRASLRLLKHSLSEKSFYKLDDSLGRAARVLSEMRDNTVNLRTFIRLFQKYPKAVSSRLSDQVLKQLTSNVSQAFTAHQVQLATTNFLLKQVQSYMREIRCSNITEEELFHSIDKAMVKAHNAYNDALYSLDTEIIHNWRKYAKSLLLQLKLAPGYNSARNNALQNSLNQLTNILGEEHDLANLDFVIRKMNDISEPGKKDLYLFISKSRAQVQKKAFDMGKVLFSRERIDITRSALLQK